MEIPVWEVSTGANHVSEWHIVSLKQEPVSFLPEMDNNMYRSDVQTGLILQDITHLGSGERTWIFRCVYWEFYTDGFNSCVVSESSKL